MLSAKSTVNYLGVELDQHLSGEHIARNAICNIHNKVKFLLRNTNFFNMKVTTRYKIQETLFNVG